MDIMEDTYRKKGNNLNPENEYLQVLNDNEDYLYKKRSDSQKIKQLALEVLKDLFGFEFAEVYKLVYRKYTNFRIRMHSTKTYKKRTHFKEYAGEKMAVYTVLFGTGDTVLEPKVIDDNCDYYVITDQCIAKESIWKKIDNIGIIDVADDVLKSRYYKILYYLLFDQYEYTLYIDANIILYGKPTELVSSINPKTGIALHNHPHRKSIYEEIFARKCLKPSDGEILDRQAELYRKKGFVSGDGIFECNAILRNNSKECHEIMDAWWKEFKEFPARDQVSLPYVLWKQGISLEEIGIIGNDIRINPYFRIKEHIPK